MKINVKSNAYQRGKSLKSNKNPYRNGTKEWHEWRAGFVKGVDLDNNSDIQDIGFKNILEGEINGRKKQITSRMLYQNNGSYER